jgi:transcriptional regulator with XRE-family HTH domain/predicted transcriptional regulator
MTKTSSKSQPADETDLLILGKRIRHYRVAAGLTLERLGNKVGVVTSALSLIENGRREPKLSLLQAIARELNVDVADLLASGAPDERSSLEIELDRSQKQPEYKSLKLPSIKSPKSLSDDTLASLVGLHRELTRRSRAAAATPEEARRANTSIRQFMRSNDNYLADIEDVAEELLEQAEHSGGALTHHSVAVMAERLGLTLIFVDDLPQSARSITDLENGRIYLPPASIPGGHGLRSLALQAMAHIVLQHDRPNTYAEFLKQRLEINYFAAACLMPRNRSVEFLQNAKANRNIAIEDFRDAFGVTHEAAAHRITNLATEFLDMRMHFIRAKADGSIIRAYENDGTPLPEDENGAVEGLILCRKWAARTAFDRKNRTSEFYQYTDTPAGTFWTAVQTGTTETMGFSISTGVSFDDAKWFRGRDTSYRTQSTCPDPDCCRAPSNELRARWEDKAWPSARMHAHVLSPLPAGEFPGIDDTELYEFLSRHADS